MPVNNRSGLIPANEKGFSLLELSVVVVAAALVMGVISLVFVSSSDIYNTVSFMSDNNQGSVRVSNVMLTDIRQVRDRNSISLATGSQFEFVNTEDDSVSYCYQPEKKRLSRTRILNGTVESDSSFYDRMSDFSFFYMDADGNLLDTTTDPLSDIRRVQVVFVDSSTIGVGVLTSKVYLRNLR